MIKLIKGDCLDKMIDIEPQSIDAIITDPPYGTTACKWDSVIPFDEMWQHLNRIIKPNGAIVLFGSEPFSSALRMSNIRNYKYDWIWEKQQGTNPFLAKKQPLRKTENVIVFNKHNYYPQIVTGKPYSSFKDLSKIANRAINSKSVHRDNPTGERYPTNIIKYNTERKKGHPTQKPVALMEYLIKTYTNENETVLDFTMGSGSTIVAAKKLGRNGIGIEKDDKYFEIAKERINK